MDLETFHKLLLFGLEHQASDIHFEVGYTPHYRIRGELVPTKLAPLRPADSETIAKFILGERTVELGGLFAEMDLSYTITDKGRFRASIFRQRSAVGIVLRAIPFDILTIEQLHLPATLREIADARRGMILITGSTGQGKTTTMASMVQHLNVTRRCHVITIEDPLEYLYAPGQAMIIQRELGTDTRSFKDALIAALRQDPDVIVVGEIRDVDTAAICLKAAETGHLVISAIHTPDTISTIQRFVGMFGEHEQDVVRERFSEAISAVISLRLLPNKNGVGRVPAVEIMRATSTIRACLKSADRVHEITKHIIEGRDLYGMVLFDQSLLDLVSSGQISIEEATYAATSPEEFKRSMTIE
jgi:twitching motility protein PilT